MSGGGALFAGSQLLAAPHGQASMGGEGLQLPFASTVLGSSMVSNRPYVCGCRTAVAVVLRYVAFR